MSRRRGWGYRILKGGGLSAPPRLPPLNPRRLPPAAPFPSLSAAAKVRFPTRRGAEPPMSLPETAFAPRSFDPGAACPLDGVRVVDLSRLVAGNAVSSQLADFGAETLKIEDPAKGDPLRAWQTGGVSVHWKLYARNNKSVALSLRAARDHALL